MKLNNPWKGVVPYTDDPEDLKIHPFKGRDKAISDLLSIISNNEITTLYGRSGIGKTSLLNAGLFPRLRELDCWPINIRLYNDCENKHYAKHIVDQLTSITQDTKHSTPFIDDMSSRFLWDFFASHTFVLNDKEVIPVIVLDQFEEILRNSPEEALTLLKQLREAKQESYREDGTRYEVNFRIVISIREDDLYLLENAIDIHFIDKMKTGRYRLQPIDRDSAREIIFIRDGLFGDISHEEEDEIVTGLTRLSDQDGAISSILLSLVCSMAFSASSTGIITHDTIKKLGDTPLISFYKESIEGLPKKFIDYLEENFVDFDRRHAIPEKHIPESFRIYVQKLADEKSSHRILTVASDKSTRGISYELLHDKLADAISKYHDERLSEYSIMIRKQRLRKWTKLLCVIFLLFGVSTYIVTITNRPINYSYQGDLRGDTIPVLPQGYFVKDSVLNLTNCFLLDYTFYGNEEVKRAELDGVAFSEKALYLPNVKELIVGPNQFVVPFHPESFPNVSTVTARRPTSNGRMNGFATIHYLDSAIIEQEDSDYLWWDWKTKTLFVRQDTSCNFQPFLSRYRNAYHTVNSNLFRGTDLLVDIDLAHLPDTVAEYGVGYRYRLVNTDATLHKLRSGIIPDKYLYRISFIHLQYVDTLCDSVFQSLRIQEAIFPDVRYVGKHTFENATIVESISMPNALSISDSAFYEAHLDSAIFESVKEIGKNAFGQYSWRGKAKKVFLPMVEFIEDSAFVGRIDENTILSYKSGVNISSSEKVFGGAFGNNAVVVSNTKTSNNTSERLGYHIEGEKLIIDSANVDHLHINKGISTIIIDNGLPFFSIEKITCEQGNRNFFTKHGNLYSDRVSKEPTLIMMPNTETMVSLPSNINLDRLDFVTDKCKRYICLNRSDISRLKNTKKIDLYVPYGQLNSFNAFESIFKSVKELSWIETVYYNTFYGRDIHRFTLGKYFIETEDIMVFIIAVIVMSLFLFVFCLKHWHRFVWWRDLLCLIIIISISFYLVSPSCFPICHKYTTSDGEHFYSIISAFRHLTESDAILVGWSVSMWPALAVALPLWTIYLVFSINRVKRFILRRLL